MTKLFYRLAALVTAAFALMAHPVSAQDAGYLLRPGDVLQVEVVEDPSLNRSTLVLPNGSITFPQAGTLRAGGRTPDQVRAALTDALAPSFAAPPHRLYLGRQCRRRHRSPGRGRRSRG